MPRKDIDEYHDNKTKRYTGYDLVDNELVAEDLDFNKVYFGMEIELELNRDDYGSDDDCTEEDCDNCNGTGHVNCDDCDGNGYVICEHCDGDGTYECSTCDGSGNIMEEDGTMHDCENCNGTGRLCCDYCEEGRIDCSNCNGEGSWECDSCDGSGIYRSYGGNDHPSSHRFDVPDKYWDTIVFEQDGSLSYGFEIITAPMTYSAMVHFLALPFMKDFVSRNQCRSSNGIHIHMTKPKDNKVIDNLMMILARNGHMLRDRTRSSSYGVWYHKTEVIQELNDVEGGIANRNFIANMYLALTEKNNGVMGNLYNRLFNDRYLALNMQNTYTIEYRFFNSTDDYNRLIQYVTLVNCMQIIAKCSNLDDLTVCNYVLDESDWTLYTQKSNLDLKIPMSSTKLVKELYDVDRSRQAPVLDLLVDRTLNPVDYHIYDRVELDTSMLQFFNLINMSRDDRMNSWKFGRITDMTGQTYSNRAISYSDYATQAIPSRYDVFRVMPIDEHGVDLATRGFWYPGWAIKGKIELIVNAPRYTVIKETL